MSIYMLQPLSATTMYDFGIRNGLKLTFTINKQVGKEALVLRSHLAEHEN